MAPKFFAVLCVLCLSYMEKVKSCKPIDCKTKEWSAWTASNKCLGKGITCNRKRGILQHPENGGKDCANLTEQKTCMLCPIDCSWNMWSKWSKCSSCGSGGRSRYRTVIQPAVFGGTSCGTASIEFDGSSMEFDDTCEPEDSCKTDKCASGDFTCSNGKCIHSRLKCNRDDDCDDNSDEIGCGNIRTTHFTPPIPGLMQVGLGYDVLSDQFKSGVLDNGKYSRTRRTIHDTSSNISYRKPWNILDYIPKVNSGQQLLVEGYASAQDYRRELKNMVDQSLSVSVGVSGILGSISSSVSSSTSAETLNIMKTSVLESSFYFKVERKNVIATFRTRHKRLMLAKSFSDDINELPAHFDYQKYTELFKRYGTHYVSSGKLGGKVDHVLRYSTNKFKSSNITISEQLVCIGKELSARILNVATGITKSRCDANSDLEQHESNFRAFASEIRTLVTGGSSATTSVLSYFTVDATKKNYRQWASSLWKKPDLVSYKLKPITKLLPAEKQANGIKALKEFLDVYEPIHCRTTCQNNGELVVVKEGRECRCICPYPYYGISCGREVEWIRKEKTASPPKNIKITGNSVMVNSG